MSAQLDKHHQALSSSITSLFSRGGPQDADYDDPVHDPDQPEDSENIEEWNTGMNTTMIEGDDGVESVKEDVEEEEDDQFVAEEEEILENADDDELDEDEDINVLQSEVSPVLNYRFL